MDTRFVALALVIAGVFSLAFLSLGSNSESVTGDVTLTAPKPGSSMSEDNALQGERPTYGIPEAVFSELPEMPRDFNMMVSLYHNNSFRDDFFFTKKYYLQPEFYPSFSQNALNYWLNPSTTHYAAYGYGSYPVRKTVFLDDNQYARARFFVHSGYGVRSYQGMKLTATPSNGAEQYFDLEISETEFLLAPNYPKFEKNWANDVVLEVRPKGEAPAGIYTFSVTASTPSREKSEQWRTMHGEKYFESGFVSTSRPLYKLMVIVE